VSAAGDLDTAATVATGAVSEGTAPMDIPDIDSSEFESWADRILTSTGQITNAAGGTIATCSGPGNPCQLLYGLKFSSGNWEIATTAAANHTYYVQGGVTVAPNLTSALAPMAVTVIATGSIDATQGFIKPYAGDLLMVTDKDLRLAGNFNAGVTLGEGQILVGEQVSNTGNPVIRGQIVIGDKPSTGVPHTSALNGSVTITNDYDVGSSMFRVAGWRQVR
jgi:hypothetical protein